MKYKHIIYNNNCIWIILITYDKRLDSKTMHIYEKCSIKDRNGMDLTEAEDIKKRWQEYTEELYKKDLHDPDNYNDVITHLARMWSQVGLRKHHYEQS